MATAPAPAPPAATAPPPSAGRWWGLAVLSLCTLVLNLDTSVFSVAIGTLARDLNADTGQLQWISTSYALTAASLLLLAGAVGDRIGRRRTLLAGLALFAAASLVGAWAPNAGTVIAVRTAMGIGAAVIVPMALALLPALFGPDERPRALALWTASVTLGAPLGPIVGGLLLDHFWWGSIFLINVVTAGVAIPLGAAVLPESRDPRPGRTDLAGVLLSTAGVGALVYGFVDAGHGWTRPATVAWLAAGVAVLAGFALRERRARDPLVPLPVFGEPAFAGSVLTMVMGAFAMMGVMFVLPLALQGVRDLSPLATGVRLLPLVLAALAGSLTVTRIAGRLGARSVVAAGMLLLAAGLALLATGGAATAPDLVLAVSLALLGYGMGLSVPPAMAAAIAAFPDARAGSGSGLVTAIRAVGGIFGVAVIGTAVSALYTGRLGGLPDSVAGPARASVANVPVLARHLDPDAAARLHATTAAAFSHGMRVVLLTCAAVAVLAALVSLRVLPPRADPEK